MPPPAQIGPRKSVGGVLREKLKDAGEALREAAPVAVYWEVRC